MELGVLQQGRQFLLCAFAGVVLGSYYDLLWTMGENRRVLTWIGDFLSGTGLLVANCLLLLYVGDGEYRIFFLVGLFVGYLLWKVTMSKLFRKGCRLFWSIIFFPTAIIWKLLIKFVKKIKFFFKNPFSKREKSVKIKGQQSIDGGEKRV